MKRYNNDGEWIGKYTKNGEFWEYTPRGYDYVGEYVQFDDEWRYHGIRIEMETHNLPERVEVYEHGGLRYIKMEFEWAEDKRHVIEYNQNGRRVYEGEYENNPLFCFPRSGFGILFDSEGREVYHGQLELNFPQGEGNIYRNGVEVYRNVPVNLVYTEISRENLIYYDVLSGIEYRRRAFTKLPDYETRNGHYNRLRRQSEEYNKGKIFICIIHI